MNESGINRIWQKCVLSLSEKSLSLLHGSEIGLESSLGMIHFSLWLSASIIALLWCVNVSIKESVSLRYHSCSPNFLSATLAAADSSATNCFNIVQIICWCCHWQVHLIHKISQLLHFSLCQFEASSPEKEDLQCIQLSCHEPWHLDFCINSKTLPTAPSMSESAVSLALEDKVEDSIETSWFKLAISASFHTHTVTHGFLCSKLKASKKLKVQKWSQN